MKLERSHRWSGGRALGRRCRSPAAASASAPARRAPPGRVRGRPAAGLRFPVLQDDAMADGISARVLIGHSTAPSIGTASGRFPAAPDIWGDDGDGVPLADAGGRQRARQTARAIQELRIGDAAARRGSQRCGGGTTAGGVVPGTTAGRAARGWPASGRGRGRRWTSCGSLPAPGPAPQAYPCRQHGKMAGMDLRLHGNYGAGDRRQHGDRAWNRERLWQPSACASRRWRVAPNLLELLAGEEIVAAGGPAPVPAGFRMLWLDDAAGRVPGRGVRCSVGGLDILVNCAGGSRPLAVDAPENRLGSR